MGDNRERMKQFFCELVDQFEAKDVESLITSEISKVHGEITEITESIRSELKGAIESIHSEIAQIHAELKVVKSAVAHVPDDNSISVRFASLETALETKTSEFDSTLTILAEKVAGKMKEMRSGFETRINELEQHATATENNLSQTQNEHNRIVQLVATIQGAFQSAPATPFPSIHAEPVDHHALFTPETDLTQETKGTPFNFANTTMDEEFTVDSLILDQNEKSSPEEETGTFNDDIQFDIAETSFIPTDNNPHPEVVVDASGQHIYRPL